MLRRKRDTVTNMRRSNDAEAEAEKTWGKSDRALSHFAEARELYTIAYLFLPVTMELIGNGQSRRYMS
jgi:hypothetical protein